MKKQTTSEKNPLKVILIRWPKGLERIDVTANDTVGEIVEKMGKKFEFDGTKITLIQESNNAKTARRTKLSQLNITNGEIFRLDIPTATDSASNQKPTDGEKRPTTANLPPKVQQFKSEWGQNAVCLSEIVGKEITVEQQTNTKIKKVLLPQKECSMVAHVIEELHFVTMRVFFLYGTVVHNNSVIRIHSISYPTQRFVNGEFQFNEQHRKSADDLAKVLGLQFLGVIVPNDIKSPPINPNVMLFLANMSKEVADDNFIVCTAIPDAGKCVFEVYQLSKQFIDLHSQNFFVGADGKNALKVKKNVYAYTKLTDSLAIEYFLVNVASVARDSWFPRARFPFQAFYPTVADFAYAMNTDYQCPDFIRLLDFNMLMFLEQWFSPGNEIPMIARICINKKELPFALTSKIEEIIASAELLGND